MIFWILKLLDRLENVWTSNAAKFKFGSHIAKEF